MRPNFAAFLIGLAACPCLGLGSATSRPDLDAPAPVAPLQAASGRDPGNYPPPRHFDHLHMLLELDIPDIATPFLTGRETLRVTPVGKARESLELDLADPVVVGVAVKIGSEAAARPVAFTRKNRKLTVQFDRPVGLNETAEVVIDYTLDFPNHAGAGLTWTAGRPDARSETDRVPQIHSQGEPDSNRRWFACHDFPNERLTTELIVTVNDGYEVLSNGRMISKDARPDGRVRWHWLQDKPHANYLVLLVIGKFGVVELNTSGTARVPCPLYVPLGTEKNAAAVYAKTPAMMSFFEKVFDEPYPWDKYAQACVRAFAAGGMENTSATTMRSESASARPGSQSDVISHELAHQWTGDLVTCKSWEHLWLNEGWATYAEALWAEEEGRLRGGPAEARRAYQREVAGFVAQETALNRTYAPDYPGLVSNRYGGPFEVFVRPNNAYSKGAVLLHMLRMRLGDDAFFRGVRLYIDRFKLKLAETDDFRKVMEEASGDSLERFFEQWAYRPGTPRLGVDFAYDSRQKLLTITVEQTQQIDKDNPAYAFTVPVYVEFDEGPGRYFYLDTDRRRVEKAFRVESRPVDAIVDPNMAICAPTDVRTPLVKPAPPPPPAPAAETEGKDADAK